MKGIIKIQARKPVLAASAFGLLIILAWRGGRWLGWPRNTIMLAILIILFIGVLLLFLKAMKANRNAASLERSIKMQAEDQMRSTRPEKKEEIEELQKDLLLAIESLKKSKLGRGRSGRSALYSLPWYMFIGPPAAGKTTAIINSGLEFSFGSDIKGVGGTRNCDWFFSNSAIILDTAGRYVTEDEDKEEWLAFLDVLKKHRRRSPINGVIIGMSIADILNASADEIEWHARNIRRRIDELIQRLGIRFPVYLVFTKLDLLQGFVETFEHLSRAERDQIWGCSLSPEEAGSGRLRDVFEQEFDLLDRALDDFRLKRLSLAAKPESRGRQYIFPMQFAGIKDSLWQFIGKVFQPSPYQEVPLFRGFYFTSGTQEGVPIDRVIQTIAKQFELPSEMISEPEIQKKSYFIQKLFTDIIVPDRNLVAQTSRAATQKSLLRAGVTVGCLILLGTFIFGVSQGYIRSRSSLRSVQESAGKLGAVNWDRGAREIDNLRALDRFRDKLVTIEEKESGRRLLWSGMSRTGTVLDAARQLYYEKSRRFISDYFYKEVERRLREIRRGGTFRRGLVMDDFTAYLLMGDESRRLRDYPGLAKQLGTLFAESAPAEGAEEVRPLVENQVSYFLKCLSLGRKEMPPFDNDPNLVQSIRALLNRPPDLDDAYDDIVRDGPEKLRQPVTLSQILRGKDLNLVSSESDSEVPEFFTRAGWEEYVKKAIEGYSQNPEKENWVLGQMQPQTTGLRDPEKLAEGLTDIYSQQYSRHWWQFLKGIRYTAFKDLRSASAGLLRLSDPKDSPLKLILERAARETRFGAEEASKGRFNRILGGVKKAGQKIGGVRDSAGTSPEGFIGGGDFARLHALCPEAAGESEAAKELNELLRQYALLDEMLASFEDDPGSKAKETAAKVIQGEGELPQAVNTIRAALPETGFDVVARGRLFEQPLKNVWTVILSEARNGLNDVWKNEVYQPYTENLAAYYPFDRLARQDAPLDGVSRFFDPKEGPIGKFISGELKPFVRLDKANMWESIPWMDQGLSLPAATIAALEKASSISRALFEQGGGGVRVSFQLQADFPEPVGFTDERKKREINKSIVQISLNIDGELYSYRMGYRYWKPFSWPGTEGPAGARLTVDSTNRYNPMRSEGPWGWFHLLDMADVRQLQQPTEYQVRWTLGLPNVNQIRVQYTLRASTPSNPFGSTKDFFHLQLPEALIPAGGGD